MYFDVVFHKVLLVSSCFNIRADCCNVTDISKY